MADNWRVLDCRVDELQANMNLIDKEPWQILSQDYYHQDGVRRVTVLLRRPVMQVQVAPGFDPHRMPRN